ncbi:unnamed protein product [Adineta ricciae]|uniref:RING-type domain-containing protein n=1 Tax=Adineta ricciae TaxID=249248 RepID=A0A815HCC7_ADIRI|nr:unnamed protein product [Adineta ricciae]CAF1352065.1 unnamed protein product [Adineta ricciae]
MSPTNEYEYEDEATIDAKLICSICLSPFIKPTITICNHIFCRNCIEIWFKKSLTCPLCREVLTTKHIKSVRAQAFLDKLDDIEVKCLICEQNGIKRRDFQYHREKFCLKEKHTHSLDEAIHQWENLQSDHQSRIPFKSFYSRRRRLANVISQYPLESTVTLRNYQLTDADMSAVVHYAVKKRQCRILDLGVNQIGSYGIIDLADSLERNQRLKLLSLYQNSICDKSMKHLAHKLATKHSYLKWLDLESTNLNDHSAEYLANMLAKNTSITGLWLSNNHIGYDGVLKLTSVLMSSNKTLKYLDLENNPSIDDSCLECLENMLRQNRTLKTVYLNRCQLSTTSKKRLRDVANSLPNFRLFL